jgi:hypothetical protein
MTDKDEDVKFIDLFNPNQARSDKDLVEERLAICNACEWLRPKTQRCRKCGCFMSLKTTLIQAKCPMGKW